MEGVLDALLSREDEAMKALVCGNATRGVREHRSRPDRLGGTMRRLSSRSMFWVLAVCLAITANVGVQAGQEIDFTGEFIGGIGLPPGSLPQICADRAGTCGTNVAVIETCGTVAGQGTDLGVFDGDTFLCIDTSSGIFIFNAYYLFRGSNGSTLFGPFQGQNVPLFPAGIPGPTGPSGFIGFGTWVVDGGTGVYEGATSGLQPARVMQSTATGVPAVIYLDGKIEVRGGGDQGDQDEQ